MLIDIALLPEFRRAGIGTALMRDLQDEARESNRPIRLHNGVYQRERRWNGQGAYVFTYSLPWGAGA